MVLHIGQDTVVHNGEIIGIFDLENTSVSQITRAFLAGSTHRDEVIDVTDEMPKSYIVCVSPESGKTSVYISQISVSTLQRRARQTRRRGI